MNDQEDQAVDRVMAGLRAAQPPDGIKQRVLQALRSRENAAARSRERRNGVRRHGWMTVAAAAIVAAGALLAVHGHVKMRSAGKRQSIAAALPASSIPEPAEIPLYAAIAKKKTSRAFRHAEMARSTGAAGGVREVSYPAPVEPLTAEEKALVQIAQHGNADAIAFLNPIVQAKREARKEREFKKFVDEPAAFPPVTESN